MTSERIRQVEARQNLSALLEEVKKGRDILITDRGPPVARLVPAGPPGGRPFPDLSAHRPRMPALDPPLSATILAWIIHEPRGI